MYLDGKVGEKRRVVDGAHRGGHEDRRQHPRDILVQHLHAGRMPLTADSRRACEHRRVKVKPMLQHIECRKREANLTAHGTSNVEHRIEGCETTHAKDTWHWRTKCSTFMCVWNCQSNVRPQQAPRHTTASVMVSIIQRETHDHNLSYHHERQSTASRERHYWEQ